MFKKYIRLLYNWRPEGIRTYLVPLPKEVEFWEQLLKEYLVEQGANNPPIKTYSQLRKLRCVANLLAEYECFHVVITKLQTRLENLQQEYDDYNPEATSVYQFLQANPPKFLKFVAAGFAAIQASSVAEWLSSYFPSGIAHPFAGFLLSLAFFIMGEEVLYRNYKSYFLDEVLGAKGFWRRTLWFIVVTALFIGIDVVQALGLLAIEGHLGSGVSDWIGHIALTLVFSIMIALICLTQANRRFHSFGQYYQLKRAQGEQFPLRELEEQLEHRQALRASILNYRGIITRLRHGLAANQEHLNKALNALARSTGITQPILISDFRACKLR